MKVQDFAYQVTIRVIELLEHSHHYKVTDEVRKQVAESIQNEIGELLKRAS